MIKVAHIITGLGTGGAEAMLQKLVSSMDRDHFSSRIISLGGKGLVGDEIEATGIPVTACNMPSGRLSIGGLSRLVGALRRDRPDIIQTWLYHADFLGGGIARFMGAKHVLWNIRHGNLDPAKNKRRTLWVVKANARLSRLIPERVICNSRQAINAHTAMGYDPARFTLIPNGFDCETYKPSDTDRRTVREELGIPSSALLVGLVARLDPQKNHPGFIEAARLIGVCRPDVHFLLAGKGVSLAEPELGVRITAADLPGRFHLVGERRDIPRLTAALDVAVCASFGESFPNAIGEAMACGVPCVVTDVGDCAEIVGTTGFVVPTGDMVTLADRVEQLLGMAAADRQRLGALARDRIIAHYSLERITEQYAFLYKTLASGGRVPSNV